MTVSMKRGIPPSEGLEQMIAARKAEVAELEALRSTVAAYEAKLPLVRLMFTEAGLDGAGLCVTVQRFGKRPKAYGVQLGHPGYLECEHLLGPGIALADLEARVATAIRLCQLRERIRAVSQLHGLPILVGIAKDFDLQARPHLTLRPARGRPVTCRMEDAMAKVEAWCSAEKADVFQPGSRALLAKAWGETYAETIGGIRALGLRLQQLTRSQVYVAIPNKEGIGPLPPLVVKNWEGHVLFQEPWTQEGVRALIGWVRAAYPAALEGKEALRGLAAFA